MVLRGTQQYSEILTTESGSLRATSQSISILSQGTNGTLRGSNQYIEILVEAINFFNDILNITDDAHFNYDKQVSFDTILNLNEDSFVGQHAFLTDEIEIIDVSYYIVLPNQRIHFEDVLTLTESLDFADRKYFTDTLTFTDDLTAQYPKHYEFTTTLYILEVSHNTNIYVRLDEELSLSETLNRIKSSNFTDTITITDEFWRNYSFENTFTITQSLIQGRTRGIPGDNLNLVEETKFNGVFYKYFTDSNIITQSFTYFNTNKCALYTYSPFMDDSVDFKIIEPIVQEDFEGVKLIYLDQQLIIRAPELDNQDISTFTRLNQETRGGNLIIFADSSWPKINTLNLNFIGLTKEEAENTQSFIQTYLGEELLLVDWEGRTWSGVVITSDNISVCNHNDNYSVTFNFEGQLLEYYPEDNFLYLEDNCSGVVERNRTLLEELELSEQLDYSVVSP